MHFYDAPGYASDWICIVPAGSPDTEAGDYKYIPEGVKQGVLIFKSPRPGQYEARAYYNYNAFRYTVSDRYLSQLKGKHMDIMMNMVKYMDLGMDLIMLMFR